MNDDRTTYTHDLPQGDVDALLARLRRCDGRASDACFLVWEQCQSLVAEVERLRANQIPPGQRLATSKERGRTAAEEYAKSIYEQE